MTMTPCKDCPDRHPACHDTCPKYAEFKRQRGAEAAYTREMLDTGKVYHYDHEDRHRERGRKGADKYHDLVTEMLETAIRRVGNEYADMLFEYDQQRRKAEKQCEQLAMEGVMKK